MIKLYFNYFGILFLILLVLQIDSTHSANILCVFTTISKSHMIIHESVARGLVERNHNVTVITTIPLTRKNPGFEHVYIPMLEHQNEFLRLIAEFSENTTTNSILHKTKLETQSMYFFAKFAADFIKKDEMQQILRNNQYDLVVLGYIFNELQLGIADHFKCPVVIVWVNTNVVNTDTFVGNPLEISYMPSLFLELKMPMGFFERLANFLGIIYEKLRNYDLLRYHEELYREIFPAKKNYRSFNEMMTNVSLLMQATHFSTDRIKPMTVNTIEIGGIHVKEKQDPLPDDIKKFLDDAESNGAIYFSLGSNAKSSDLDSSTVKKIFNVFEKLPQKIIWKWETDQIPGKSLNIFYGKWLPQDDILAHPNVKLFISHGGLGGITEARYHAVPIIGLPLFGDQFSNVKQVEESGWGIFLDIEKLNEKDFMKSIEDILYNQTYSNNIKRISKIYKDRPQSPMETAMYWIEYVLRYNGASHLQCLAIKIPYWKLYSIDVIMFLLFIVYILLTIVKLFVKFIIHCCCSRILLRLLNSKEKTN